MVTSMKLGLATTVAALSIAAVTSACAAINPTSAGKIVGQAVARAQSRTPGVQPIQCWITADDNDHGNFGYWGSCSSPMASAASAPASPVFGMQAEARRKCEEHLGSGRTSLFGCGGQFATEASQGGWLQGRPTFPNSKHTTKPGASE